jgi:uncharacterized protein (UPF0335 family)
MTDSTNGAELRAIIERIERLEAEKQDAAEAQKEVYAEAKGTGYDSKIIRAKKWRAVGREQRAS